MDSQAVEWFRRAHENGSVAAAGSIARAYEIGQGLASDERAAFDWYSKSADLGSVKAAMHLARCYSYGIGTDADRTEADKWADIVIKRLTAQAQAGSLAAKNSLAYYAATCPRMIRAGCGSITFS